MSTPRQSFQLGVLNNAIYAVGKRNFAAYKKKKEKQSFIRLMPFTCVSCNVRLLVIFSNNVNLNRKVHTYKNHTHIHTYTHIKPRVLTHI